MTSAPDPYGRRGRTQYEGAGSPRQHRTHRRLVRLGIGALHPACRAAVIDLGTPCGRCAWLMDLDIPAAEYTNYHVDDDDDDGGA